MRRRCSLAGAALPSDWAKRLTLSSSHLAVRVVAGQALVALLKRSVTQPRFGNLVPAKGRSGGRALGRTSRVWSPGGTMVSCGIRRLSRRWRPTDGCLTLSASGSSMTKVYQLILGLLRRYAVEPSLDPVVWRQEGQMEELRLTPDADGAAQLSFSPTDFPGVAVRFGRWHEETYPAWGCDACD